jgi:hypothetical protein
VNLLFEGEIKIRKWHCSVRLQAKPQVSKDGWIREVVRLAVDVFEDLNGQKNSALVNLISNLS